MNATTAGPKGEGPAALRWGLCLGSVLLLHGAAWLALNRVVPEPPVTAPVDAIMVDLAPVAQAPPVSPPVSTPAPEPPPPEPDPTPPQLPTPAPVPVVPATPRPEVALPAPKPVARPRPPRQAVRPPAPAAPVQQAPSSPPMALAPPAPAPAAASAQVTATWQSLLIAHIARFKRYPVVAQRRGDQGVAYVRFVIDRDGDVLSATLARGSGHAELDQEAIAWLERAQPLPKPPPEVARDRLELVLPMRFELQ